ncbi:MAG: hypothetical protein K2J23_00570 [Muribaculaceae bacterium]|nr:hypothetical protein [Muribaculaceae bacterium]MDE6865875.1 hypothetical protein [Muribaculaceae bacterium]
MKIQLIEKPQVGILSSEETAAIFGGWSCDAYTSNEGGEHFQCGNFYSVTPGVCTGTNNFCGRYSN